jgi:hypothetical protein
MKYQFSILQASPPDAWMQSGMLSTCIEISRQRRSGMNACENLFEKMPLRKVFYSALVECIGIKRSQQVASWLMLELEVCRIPRVREEDQRVPCAVEYQPLQISTGLDGRDKQMEPECNQFTGSHLVASLNLKSCIVLCSGVIFTT